MHKKRGCRVALPPLCVDDVNCLLLWDYLQPVAEVIEVSFYGRQLRGLLPALKCIELIHTAHCPVLNDSIFGYPFLSAYLSYFFLQFLCRHFYAALFSSPRCCQYPNQNVVHSSCVKRFFGKPSSGTFSIISCITSSNSAVTPSLMWRRLRKLPMIVFGAFCTSSTFSSVVSRAFSPLLASSAALNTATNRPARYAMFFCSLFSAIISSSPFVFMAGLMPCLSAALIDVIPDCILFASRVTTVYLYADYISVHIGERVFHPFFFDCCFQFFGFSFWHCIVYA